MRMRTTLFGAALSFCATPGMSHEWASETQGKPRSLTAFMVAERTVEMRALTRRAQADTHMRREHIKDAINMSRVYPGYPQPAVVTIDFRVKF